MKLKIFTIAFIITSLIGAYSCSTDENESLSNQGENVVAKITANIANNITTKAHDGQWDENDAIGLIMLSNGGTEIVNNVFNYQYYTPSASGSFQPQDQNKTIYLPQDGSRVSFRSYYPYYQNLATDMMLPVSVKDQATLPNIDVMTAEHDPAGFSKTDSEVRLVFHHRLSKMIFKLKIEDGQPAFSLKDLELTMKGMKTTGSYDLLTDTLLANSAIEDIPVPVMSTPAQRDAIVLPRKSGSGVSFQFKAPDGSEYIAKMHDTLSLNPGYKYTFYINLKQTEATVSAVVEPWTEGPTSNYDALQVTTPAGESSGVKAGDELRVFLEGENGFAILDTLTYNQDGKWYSTPPIYWQNIPTDPARLRASMEAHRALNNTQLPDILIADEISVQRNTGANFTLRHAASKVIVQLQSSVFSVEDLANAKITLPGYLGGAKEENGVFIGGQTRADIAVDRADVNNGIAVFQPQSVSANAPIVKVTINNRDYEAVATSQGYTFNPGEASRIILRINQNGVEFSATVVDWVNLPDVYFDVLSIGTSAQQSSGVKAGDQMKIYLEGENGFAGLDTLTYGQDGKWSSNPPLYWQSIPTDPARLRAAIEAAPAINNTQLPDILISNEISVQRNNAADFVFNHAASKVIVQLQSTTFSTQDLAGAKITLPGYLGGAKEQNGVFVAGQTRADITLDRTDTNNAIAIFQPQAISPNGTIVRVTINGRNYDATVGSEGYTFKSGEASKLILKLNKNGVEFSATVVDWTNIPNAYYEVLSVATPAQASSGVTVGDQMNVYLQDNTDFNLLNTFTYNSSGKWYTDTQVYWENIQQDPAVFKASIIAAPALNTSQMSDILIANQISVPRNGAANFTLNHAGSKIIIRLLSSTFSTTDLANATITLPNYLVGGAELNGDFVPGQTRGNITVDRKDPENSTAIIQPQTVTANGALVKITIGGRDYTVYATASGLEYKAGEALAMIVTVNKTNASFSANVIDWTDATINLSAVTIGTPVSGATGVLNGEELNVYIDNGSTRPLAGTYTYVSASNQFTSSTPLYWESLSDPTTFYGSILRQAKYNNTQLDDYLIAQPVQVAASNGVTFNLSHPAAKIIVRLTSSDGSFSATELGQMTMVLPNYATGGTFDSGVFTPGTGVGNITVEKNVGTGGNSAIAIVQPQTIGANTTVISVTSPSTGRVYNGTLSTPTQFAAGVATVLNVDMKKTLGSMSANVVDWINGDIISMVPKAIQVTGTLDDSSDFFKNKTVSVYKFGGDFQSLTYSYLPGTTGYAWTGVPIYWDDQQSQTLNVTAVYYPYENLIPNVTSSTASFIWNLPTVQSQGYDYYDLVTSHLTLTSPQYVNFIFNHPLSKVRVELSSMEFTAAELSGATVQLNGFLMNGSIIMISGAASPTGSRVNVVPNTDTDGSKYSALVMPQTIAANSGVVTITLKGYPNTPFTGTLSNALNFVAGKETVIKVDLKKTKIDLSAKLQNWTDGETGNIVIQ